MPVPATPAAAAEVFGSALPRAERYCELLATDGVERGLIGPREVDRLWDRHMLNCAVIEELVPSGTHVVDLGSGAGLPGVVLAMVRADVKVTLLEPLLRRTVFLSECRDTLELDNVEVMRGRAEELVGRLCCDVVTARAVAPLDRLAGWALPLLKPGGRLLAMKGDRAEEEVADAKAALERAGVQDTSVIRLGQGRVDPPTTVVRVVAGTATQGRRRARGRGGRGARKG